MFKPLIFAASLLSGGALVTYAVSMQQQARTFQSVSIAPSPESVRVVPPEPSVQISEPAPAVIEPAALEIEPVVIEARARPRATPAAAPPKAEPRPQAPCSSWRELGPEFTSSGAEPGTHQVRELC